MKTLTSYLRAIGAEYVGQSYEDDSKACFGGDWNRIFRNEGPDRLTRISNLSRLERLAGEKNIELRYWEDFLTDSKGRVHGTIPQYHGWMPTYKITEDGEVIAEDEAESDLEGYAETLINDPRNVDLWHTDFSPLGFELLEEEYATGFHHGQTDSPDKVADRLEREGFDYIFQVSDKGQFDVHWQVWVRKQEESRSCL